jgi:hypothetical protein
LQDRAKFGGVWHTVRSFVAHGTKCAGAGEPAYVEPGDDAPQFGEMMSQVERLGLSWIAYLVAMRPEIQENPAPRGRQSPRSQTERGANMGRVQKRRPTKGKRGKRR